MIVFILYQILTVFFLPIILIYFFIRIINNKEDFSVILNRFGLFFPIKTRKKIIYIHAGSVGEVKSCFKMIEILLQKNYFIKITVMTKTSYNMIKSNFSNNKNIHISFVPIDILPFIIIFFLILKPFKVIFIESEIWPNLIFFAKIFTKNNVNLANLRMSSKSYSRWMFLKEKLKFNPFRCFKVIFTAGQGDVEKMKNFNKNVQFCGNLKNDYMQIYPLNIDINNIKNCFQSDEILLFASTHSGEEDILLSLKSNNYYKIIAPRNPVRVEKICEIVVNFGYTPILFSNFIQNSIKLSKKDCLIIDKIGYMSLFYEISKIIFICGSFVDKIGGHNPLEAINHKKPVIMGEFHPNCTETIVILKNASCIKTANLSNIQGVFDEISENYNFYVKNIEKFILNDFSVSQNVVNAMI